MHSQLLLPIASLKRNPPLMWNFSMTGNLRCFKLYRTHVKLIVCGSATSWMIDKLINNRGGLHHRLTHRMPIEPFTLQECEQYFDMKGFGYSNREIAECYMIMGGVPFYLKQMQKGFSVAQNIDHLFFEIGCALDGEFDNLYRALFKYSENYIRIVEVLSSKGKGLTRQ